LGLAELKIWLDCGDDILDRSIAEMLSGLGCQVNTTLSEGGSSKQRQYDIQIVDARSFREVSYKMVAKSQLEKSTVLIGSMAEKKQMLEAMRHNVDDFLITPIDPNELHARLAAISRIWSAHNPNHVPQYQLSVFDHTLDAEESALVTRDGVKTVLSKMEFLVLWSLARRPSKILTRNQIMDFAYEGSRDIADRMIDYHICKIRKKLKSNNVPLRIKSRHGQGYKLEGRVNE
jgi:DNA-binding response OmpR family regulator